MARAEKMELLRSLIVQCLSAAAEEIFKTVERTILEYEQEMSCWAVDRRWTDASHGEENLQTSNTDAQWTLPVSMNLDDHQETLVIINNVKQEFDQDMSWTLKQPEDRSLPLSLYRCPLCERCFTCRSEFIVHLRTHEGQDCVKSLETKDSSFTHRQKDAAEKPNKCIHENVDMETKQTENIEDKLNRKASSPQTLRLHLIQTDNDEDVSANGVASDQRDLKRLRPNHFLSTTQAGQTTRLLLTGTTAKPFKCPSCAKCFSLRKTLMRHVKIHAADKPYTCRFCGRNFCQKSALICHTRVHTGEKPYGCSQCNCSFTQKSNLMSHMRKHVSHETPSVHNVDKTEAHHQVTLITS